MNDGDRIKEKRKELGWSQPELATRIGTSQQNVQRMESGSVKHSRWLTAAMKELGLNEVAPTDASVPDEVFGKRDLPIFPAVEGGPGEILVSNEPIEFVPRPWFLLRVRDGYGVIVTGESMVPVYRPGDMVLVNPRLPPERGRNAIFMAQRTETDYRASVKELVRSSPTDWHVKQWNEQKEFKLSKAEWPKALRIVGKYEGY